MIKTQTAVKGVRREGAQVGREEGREEERFLERRGRQDMQKEGEEKEEGKHRVGLFQAKVVSLQGICTCLCQPEEDKTLPGHFLM